MKNALILGCGRSGTSAAAGTLRRAGYFMGETLIPPAPPNPRGFFESREIHDLNEAVLAPLLPPRWGGRLGVFLYRSERTGYGQRWLARLPVGTPIRARPRLLVRMEALVRREPFCFKDPRFCYTLPAWRPLLRDTLFVCVFRHPEATARSILHEVQSRRYLRKLVLDHERALSVWLLMYRHILEVHVPAGGEWLFLHYHQLLDGSGLDRLGEALGAEVDREFIDPRLSRFDAGGALAPPLRAVYDELCARAGYREG